MQSNVPDGKLQSGGNVMRSEEWLLVANEGKAQWEADSYSPCGHILA